jgi:hypothetical protein
MVSMIGVLIFWPDRDKFKRSAPTTNTPAARPVLGPSAEELRRLARERTERLLDAADAECRRLIGEQLKSLDRVFDGARHGVPGFVENALSLQSKWLFMRDRLPFTESGQHAAFLRESFMQHVLAADQLRLAIEHVVRAYFSAIDCMENQMLVCLRADLDDLPHEMIALAHDRKQMDQFYADAVAGMLKDANRVVQVDLAADVGTLVLTKALAVLAQRWVTSGMILSTGAAGSLGTFGLTVLAGLVADQVLGWIWDKVADPRGKLERDLNKRLVELHRVVIDGEGSTPGLWQRLEQWADERAKVRRAAVLKLLEGEGGRP